METILQKSKFFVCFIILIACISCDDNLMFTSYKTLENSSWEAHQKINFEFDVTDTLSAKNVFINIRNNKEYAFSNLYVIAALDFPNGTQIIDTLQYEMANEKGEFLGNGITDLKENKLFYKENKIFPVSGKYKFSVRQAMRKNGAVTPIAFLEGIQDVGLTIEKIK